MHILAFEFFWCNFSSLIYFFHLRFEKCYTIFIWKRVKELEKEKGKYKCWRKEKRKKNKKIKKERKVKVKKKKKSHTKCEKKRKEKEKKKKNRRIVEFKRVNPYVLVNLCESFIPYYNWNGLALFKYTSISFSFHYPTFFITTLKSPFDLCVHWDIRVDIEMINKPMVVGLHRWNWVKHNPYILWE